MMMMMMTRTMKKGKVIIIIFCYTRITICYLVDMGCFSFLIICC